MDEYFKNLDKRVKKTLEIANKARAKGLDPVNSVEIMIARNMAERVVGLISVVAPQIKDTNVTERIQELEEEYGKLDWRVALKIAEEVSREKFCKFKDKIESMEIGIRVGMAYVTNGVVSSPLEGFTNLKVRERKDGKEYLSLFFSGPIRSAGGTGASVSVIIADYIRKKFGYSVYDPDEKEIKRFCTELRDYHERITNLQYFPSDEEIEFMVKGLGVQIDGDPSEKLEVSNYKDLERIDTNRIRNGVCLVMGEGLCQKAPKLWKQLSKWGHDFELEQWDFLEGFLETQKKIKAHEKTDEDSGEKIKPDYTFIKDLVAGRPVLTHPLRVGGFRLRYGRARNTGLSSLAIHPATMVVLDDYIAIGSQVKIERPSKGSALSACDSIEGPIVKLNNGDVVFLDNVEKAKKYCKDIKEIIFLGDLLVPYGDFFNRAHVLIPPGYCEEWWLRELEAKIKDVELSDELKIIFDNISNDFNATINFTDALKFSQMYKIPIHPRWTYHWNDLSGEDFQKLLGYYRKGRQKGDNFVLPKEKEKRLLELIGLQYRLVGSEIIIEGEDMKSFCYFMGQVKNPEGKNGLEILNINSEIKLRDKSGYFIGARMGRPEKGKMRKLKGNPHVLFPVGDEGGRLKSFQSALQHGKVTGEFSYYYCDECKIDSAYHNCHVCGKGVRKKYFCRDCNDSKDEKCELKKEFNGEVFTHRSASFKKMELPVRDYFDAALKQIKIREYPELIKGLRETSNQDHTVENLSKGILRSRYGLSVNKDGTIRFDGTELALTAFKPSEIDLSLEKLEELGYDKDIKGEEITSVDQVIEIKPQDIILPRCDNSSEDGCDKVFFRAAKFIDELLVKVYHEKKFYNLKKPEDLIGHLTVALAPHISAGTVARIIGFSRTQVLYAHPYLHCACRRDCDGDEIAVTLLLDTFLNFSRKYLSAHRGATQDAPLVVSSNLIAGEVDDMVFDMDIVDNYPLEFYEACENFKMPWDFKIKQIADVLETNEEYINHKFTHPVSNINNGVVYSAYKSIPNMAEKVIGQINLAEKIRAVDVDDVARLVIDRHFIRDLKGNLRKFGTQEYRCVSCNEKYRRPPLSGICNQCGGKLLFTVSEGSVIKYLEPSLSLAAKYDLPPYLTQSLDLVKMMIESFFGKEKDRQEGLGKWFG
jgi:DNA polymerase II large subunit